MVRGTLLRSSLSPIEAQRRADMWLRIGISALMIPVAVVAYLLRELQPLASLLLWLSVAGVLVILAADYAARFLPSR